MMGVWVICLFRSNSWVTYLNYRVKILINVIWEGVTPDSHSLRSTHIFCNCTGTLMVPLQLQCGIHELHYSHVVHYN